MIVNNPSAPDIDVVAVTEAIEKVFQTLDPWFEAKRHDNFLFTI